MSNWKKMAVNLWKQGLSWNEITDQMEESNFKNYDKLKLKEKIRAFIRTTPEYKFKNVNFGATSEPDISTNVSQGLNSDGSIWKERIVKFKDINNITEKDILEAHGFDATKWKVINAKHNYYEMQVKDGETGAYYQSKVTVKPLDYDDISIYEFMDFLTEYKPRILPYQENRVSKGNQLMLEVAPVDVHLGKLAWDKEVGKDYDLSIAGRRLLNVVGSIVERCKGMEIDKIIYPSIGQDFFQFDTPQYTTTSGTAVDYDTRWQKVYETGFDLTVQILYMLAKIAPVEGLYIAGNHDRMSSMWLALALQKYFSVQKNIDVHVDVSPTVRKYRRWGVTNIGYTHGDWDAKRLHTIMPIEDKENWGATIYHEMHSAHKHHERAKSSALNILDEHGTLVRHLPSISGTDSWEKDHGFVGATRRVQSFLYDYNCGLTDILYTPLD